MSTTTSIQGRDYVTLEGLLDRAHKGGLSSIRTKVLVLPHESDGIAVAHAEVITSQGVFEGTGDASTDNVGDGIGPHLVRMAETRAIVRALRWATNSASTAAEELGTPGVRAQPPEPQPSNGNGLRKVTSRQIGMIIRLLREKKISQDDLRGQIAAEYGCDLEDLGISDASKVIQGLMS